MEPSDNDFKPRGRLALFVESEVKTYFRDLRQNPHKIFFNLGFALIFITLGMAITMKFIKAPEADKAAQAFVDSNPAFKACLCKDMSNLNYCNDYTPPPGLFPAPKNLENIP